MSDFDDTAEGCVKAVGGLIGVGIVFPLACAYHGFVIHKLRGWIAVPAFGLAPVTPAAAYGLSLLVCMLRPSSESVKDEYLKPVLSRVVGEMALRPTVALAVGYAFHCLVAAGYLSLTY